MRYSNHIIRSIIVLVKQVNRVFGVIIIQRQKIR
jgi:hypothetical protein